MYNIELAVFQVVAITIQDILFLLLQKSFKYKSVSNSQ